VLSASSSTKTRRHPRPPSRRATRARPARQPRLRTPAWDAQGDEPCPATSTSSTMPKKARYAELGELHAHWKGEVSLDDPSCRDLGATATRGPRPRRHAPYPPSLPEDAGPSPSGVHPSRARHERGAKEVDRALNVNARLKGSKLPEGKVRHRQPEYRQLPHRESGSSSAGAANGTKPNDVRRPGTRTADPPADSDPHPDRRRRRSRVIARQGSIRSAGPRIGRDGGRVRIAR